MAEERRRAILIGNNEYEYVSCLKGCVKDVDKMYDVLSEHEDRTRNYHALPFFNQSHHQIRTKVRALFNSKREVESVVFYFAGHGFVNDSGGYLCGIDAQKANPGIGMKWLADQINASEIAEIIVILDCCHAGAMLDCSDGENEFSIVRKGVTILAATTKEDVAEEYKHAGIFTTIISEGLNGAAKDAQGNVTAFELYKNADKALTTWQQRPVFKSFVTRTSSLRKCIPKIEKLRVLEINKKPFFSKVDQSISLTKDMLNVTHESSSILDTLSQFERAGFLEFPENKTLLQAVLTECQCQLSPFGKHVWQLNKRNINL